MLQGLYSREYEACLHTIAVLSFGHSSAQYWQLIDFLAIVSTILWVLVVVTTIIRFGSVYRWRRHVRRVTKEIAARGMVQL